MAEETESGKNKPQVETFHKGLNTDFSPENQPDGTYRFALNGVLESQEGDYMSITNEQANSICAELPEDFVPIGSIYMNNDERVLFLVNKDESDSQIGVLKNCKYETYIQAPCLNFKLNRPVKGLFRVRNGCERNIYFIDAYNADRSINLDRLDIYKDTDDNWVCSEFNLIRCEENLDIVYAETYNDGGATKVGKFQITARYLDEYNNSLPFNQLSRPFNVVTNNYERDSVVSFTNPNYAAYLAISGGLLADNPLSSKSFAFDINNINPNYPYLEIAIVETSNNTSSGFVVSKISINGQTSLRYLYTGTETSYAYPIDITTIVDRGSRELTSTAITQAESRLIRANTSEPYIDWTPFFKSALKSTSFYYISDDSDKITSRSKDSDNPTGFMGDEVYAFGIRWIIDDCIESPVFHIPGRAKIFNESLVTQGNNNVHNRQPVVSATQWDSQLLVIDRDDLGYGPHPTNDSTLNRTESAFLLNTNTGNPSSIGDPSVQRWQMFNTAIKTDGFTFNLPGDNNPQPETSGYMAYHESSCEVYPEVKDCNGDPLYSYMDDDVLVDLSNTPVRHHKMPDRTLESHFTDGSRLGIRGITARYIQPGFIVDFPTDWDPKRLKYQIVTVTRDDNNSTVVDAGVISLAPYTRRNAADTPFAYNAVTTNYNFTSTNLANPVNCDLPLDWFYTHFVSPSFTHENKPLEKGYYKLERILIGEMERWAQLNASHPPRFSTRLWLTTSLIPGSTTPGGSFYRVLGTANPLISTFPNWYYRTIKYSEQIGFNESKIITGSVSKQTYNPSGIPPTVYNDMPPELTRFGSLANQRCQKGTIMSHEANQRIPDYINSRTVFQDYTDCTDLKSKFSAYGNIPAINLMSYWATRTSDANPEGDNYDLRDVQSWPAYYGILKNNNTCPYQGLDTLVYRAASRIYDGFAIGNQGQDTTQTKALADIGDVYIGRFDYTNTSYNLQLSASTPNGSLLDPLFRSTLSDPYDQEEKSVVSTEAIFFVESPINVSLSANNSKVGFDSNPHYKFATGGELLNFEDRYHNGPTESYTEGQLWQPIYYRYNRDFSKLSTENTYFPLPNTYNFCSDCINKNSNRIYYSEKSFVEELTDFYRIFLVNNYKDIPAETGQIINLSTYNNAILIDTEESRWVQRYSDQQIETNEATITIGTGAFFGIEADRLYTTDIGFFGNQSRFSTLVTEYGVFSIDSRGKRIFLSNELKPSAISNQGMVTYFRESLGSKLKDQIEELIGVEQSVIDWDTPMNIYNPVGLISSLDTKFNRIIVTNHDWLLTDAGVKMFNDGDLALVDSKWGKLIGVDEELETNIYESIEPKNNPDLFENKSWTMSFSVKDGCWASWHSYMPTFMFGNKYQLCTYNDGKIYLHNKFDRYQNFYGVHYPYILEVATKAQGQESTIFDSIQYNSIARQWDDSAKDFVDKRFVTFDKAIFYNSYQNSGKLDLITKKKSEFWSRQFQNKVNEATVDVNEKVFSINGFKDLVGDYNKSLFTKNWSVIAPNYFIDKEINQDSIDLKKNWSQKASFRDRYLLSRLFFTIFENIRMTTQLSSFKKTKSIR